MPVDSTTLRFGPYATPRFRYGQRVQCEVRGEVVIVGLSNGRIPWPLGRVEGNNNKALVIYRGLAKAIRREAAVAVCHHWRVTGQTVSRWRKIMGIGPVTAGSTALRRSHSRRNYPKVKARWHAKAHDSERAAKIAAAKLGKPRPAGMMEALSAGNVGRKHSAETRAKMRAARLRYLKSLGTH